jgi:zinc/manganese transport system substrate-binding protein
MNSREVSPRHAAPRVTAQALAALAVGAIALTGCGGSAPPPSGTPAPSADAGKISVVTSTDVYGAIATAIAGDRAAVTPIIKSPDADPHEYETTPADALAVSKAAVVVANGGGYDDFAGKLIESAGSKPSVVDVSELSGLKTAVPAGQEFNEHVWYNLPAMAKLADQLALDLGKADPADAAAFTANATRFKSALDGLSAKVAAIKTAHAGNRVAITEPVPLYLIQAAGLENATPEAFSEAVELGKDPSAAVLGETLELFRSNPVKALLANTQTESATTQQVEQAAGSAGVPIVRVTETLPAGAGDYLSWMGGQIDQLAAALDKK